MLLVLMCMGMMPLGMLRVTKEISSASLDAVGELLERGEGRQLIVPEGEHGDGQRDDQCRQRAGDAAQQLRERVTLHGDLLKKSRNIDKILEHFITTFVVLQGFWGDKGAKKQAL